MIQFFRRLRHKLFSEGQLGKYLFYALGEIILVVLGILIALQINNWNNRRLQRADELKSYQKIKEQIEDDHTELVEVKAHNQYFFKSFVKANAIILASDRKRVDSLALFTIYLSQFSDFNREGNIHETLINSGEIKWLSRSDITRNLQKLETTYNHINKLEDIHWDIIMTELNPELRGVINYATMQTVKPDKLFSVEIQNIFVESIFLTMGKDSVYSKALSQIEELIELIDEEEKGER